MGPNYLGSATASQAITPRLFGCLDGGHEHKTMAEADACDASRPGLDPGKNMDDWKREVDGECDEREEE